MQSKCSRCRTSSDADSNRRPRYQIAYSSRTAQKEDLGLMSRVGIVVTSVILRGPDTPDLDISGKLL